MAYTNYQSDVCFYQNFTHIFGKILVFNTLFQYIFIKTNSSWCVKLVHTMKHWWLINQLNWHWWLVDQLIWPIANIEKNVADKLIIDY